jgi:hypothetical protein
MGSLRVRLLRSLLLGVGAVVAIGCGEALSEDEYRREMTALCEQADEQIEDNQATSPLEVPDVLDEAIEFGEQNLDEIDALEPPEELSDDHDEFVAITERQLDRVRDAREQFDGPEGADPAEVFEELNAEIADDQGRANEIMMELDIEACLSQAPSS